MNSKSLLALAFAATALNASGSALAETYQWKDSSGQTVISDTPPPATVKSRRSIGGNQPSVVSEKPAEKVADSTKAPEGPKTTAEKDLEFKKRQQEAKEKADKEAKEAAATRARRDNCDRARANYRMLQSDIPVIVGDKDMSQKQRLQEMERTRRIMQESCK